MITAKEHLENTSHMDWLTVSQKLLVEAFMESYYELRKEQEIKKECAMDIMKTGVLEWSKELRDKGVIETPIEEVIANAKLIAAAPKLLQGLIDLKSQLIDGGFSETSVTVLGIDVLIKEATK
jgi:hypothetical protein